MKQRILTGLLVTTALVLAGVLFAFAFGTPQAPPQSARAGVGSSAVGQAPMPGIAADEGSDVASGQVPPPDPGSPLAVEIPGCVCHSDDPDLVQEHSGYRMNQCFGCHAGGMPEMGR